MKQIALIGAGQVGSRHLQALAKCTFPTKIQVVDPNPGSLVIAEKRFREVAPPDSNLEIEFLPTIEDLASEIDLCIIATTSKVRLAILRSLLAHTHVRYIVLEKVAFTSELEFDEAATLLERSGAKAWVNFPRRMYADYLRLKEKIQNESIINYVVEGNDYGLGCNAIHFIDHVAMLTSDSEYQLNMDEMDRVVFQSKRDGYVDFSGKMKGKFSKGSVISLKCSHSVGIAPSFTIRISGNTFEIVINELSNSIEILRDTTGKLRDLSFAMEYQSSLTHIVTQELFTSGNCRLTSFSESRKLHLPFLRDFTSLMNEVTGTNHTSLPIT